MTTDWKALCAELFAWAEKTSSHYYKQPDVLLRARAALAEQPVMPTDEELLHVAAISIEPYESSGIATGEYEPETECAVEVYGSELIAYARAVLARWGNHPAKPNSSPANGEVGEGPPAVTTGAWLHPAYEPGDGSADGAQMVELAWWHPQFGCDSLQMVVDNARAILARWGNHQVSLTSSTQPLPEGNHPAKPDGSPADDEVAELVEWLRDRAESTSLAHTALRITRAADLLQRLSPPQPVPVSERLPGPADCDVEGRCWFGRSESEDWSADWTLAIPEAVAEFCEFSPRTVWLPFHALPLPQGEVSE